MSDSTKAIKPIDGIKIRDPLTKVIITKKEITVPWTGSLGNYWRRRVRDGSADIVCSTKEKKETKDTGDDNNNEDPVEEVEETGTSSSTGPMTARRKK